MAEVVEGRSWLKEFAQAAALAGNAEDRKAVRIDNSEFNEVVPSPDLRRHRRGLQ
jgi:hypothetical protein